MCYLKEKWVLVNGDAPLVIKKKKSWIRIQSIILLRPNYGLLMLRGIPTQAWQKQKLLPPSFAWNFRSTKRNDSHFIHVIYMFNV